MNRNNRLFTEDANGFNNTPLGLVFTCALILYGKRQAAPPVGKALAAAVINELLSAAAKNGFAKLATVKERMKRPKGYDSRFVDLLEELCANVGDDVMTAAFNGVLDRLPAKLQSAVGHSAQK
jgi:hypothetical protein